MKWTDLLLTFPRVVSGGQQIWFKKQLMDWLNKNNGLRKCLVSSYMFGSTKEEKVMPESVWVDKLVMFIDNYESAVKLNEALKRKDAIRWIMYDREKFYFLIPISFLIQNYWMNVGNHVANMISYFERFGVFALQESYEPLSMIPFPNTLNPKTGRFCVSLDDKLDIGNDVGKKQSKMIGLGKVAISWEDH
jgi:hypothetical protein